MKDTDYETQLAEWKSKHGIDPNKEVNPHEVRMAQQEKVDTGESWCIECGKKMPIKEMRLITRYIDPYMQIDEGPTDYIAKANRIRMCPDCFKEKHENERE